MDMKPTFLDGKLKCVVYVDETPRFE